MSRAERKLARESFGLYLAIRHKLQGDFDINYGWIRLPYSGDDDEQEAYYHQHQARLSALEREVLRSLVPPGGTVIDVGANMGFVATTLSRLVGPDGLVVAFEPSAKTFEKLEWTIRINGLSNVRAINAGCGRQQATLTLRNVTPSSGRASIVGNGPVREQITILRLDDIPQLQDRTVDFIKVDTEGFEADVLEGAREMIRANRPLLYLELGGRYLDSTLRSIEVLRELGYDVRHVESVDWSQYGGGENFFFRPLAADLRRAPYAAGHEGTLGDRGRRRA